MQATGLLIPLAIYLFIPLTGVVLFAIMCWKMTRARITDPPLLTLFLLFVNYGGVLICLLTLLFWEWSGLASLGLAYLVFIAPVLTGISAYHLKQRCHESPLLTKMYWAALGYFAALPLCALGSVITG